MLNGIWQKGGVSTAKVCSKGKPLQKNHIPSPHRSVLQTRQTLPPRCGVLPLTWTPGVWHPSCRTTDSMVWPPGIHSLVKSTVWHCDFLTVDLSIWPLRVYSPHTGLQCDILPARLQTWTSYPRLHSPTSFLSISMLDCWPDYLTIQLFAGPSDYQTVDLNIGLSDCVPDHLTVKL